MHPDIEKFWKDLGYTIDIDILQSDYWKFYWAVHRVGKYPYQYVGQSDPVPPGTKKAKCTLYFIDGKEFSENEMLKVIKLKAFI
jgi:hypothetical protein